MIASNNNNADQLAQMLRSEKEAHRIAFESRSEDRFDWWLDDVGATALMLHGRRIWSKNDSSRLPSLSIKEGATDLTFVPSSIRLVGFSMEPKSLRCSCHNIVITQQDNVSNEASGCHGPCIYRDNTGPLGAGKTDKSELRADEDKWTVVRAEQAAAAGLWWLMRPCRCASGPHYT